MSDKESDRKSTTSENLHQVPLLNPQDGSVELNKTELLHQKMLAKSKNKKNGNDTTEEKEVKKRIINIDKSSKLATQPKTKTSVLSSKDFAYKPEDSTGIEILDMHRKIVEKVSQVKFDESLVVIEHIPKNQVLYFHIINLKGTLQQHKYFDCVLL